MQIYENLVLKNVMHVRSSDPIINFNLFLNKNENGQKVLFFIICNDKL